MTYPEGQTPDNPFIIEVVRDDTSAVAVVTLHDPNHVVAEPTSPEGQEMAEQEAQAPESDDDSLVIWLGVAGAVLLAVVVLGIVALVRRRR